jgi:hypothetical protein
MCSLCASCKTECYCPRCPHRAGKLRGWPPQVQLCSICGVDDRDCKDPVCAVTEHYMLGDAPFCQMCVEAAHLTRFPCQQFGMYCSTHEQAHKSRMFTVV